VTESALDDTSLLATRGFLVGISFCSLSSSLLMLGFPILQVRVWSRRGRGGESVVLQRLRLASLMEFNFVLDE